MCLGVCPLCPNHPAHTPSESILSYGSAALVPHLLRELLVCFIAFEMSNWKNQPWQIEIKPGKEKSSIASQVRDLRRAKGVETSILGCIWTRQELQRSTSWELAGHGSGRRARERNDSALSERPTRAAKRRKVWDLHGKRTHVRGRLLRGPSAHTE